jgi:hypothetical protein
LPKFYWLNRYGLAVVVPGGVAAGDVDFLALALAHAVKLGADAALFQAGLDSVAQVGKALLKVDAKAMEDVVSSGGDRVHLVHSAVPLDLEDGASLPWDMVRNFD